MRLANDWLGGLGETPRDWKHKSRFSVVFYSEKSSLERITSRSDSERVYGRKIELATLQYLVLIIYLIICGKRLSWRKRKSKGIKLSLTYIIMKYLVLNHYSQLPTST